MQAMTFNDPPHRPQASISTEKKRLDTRIEETLSTVALAANDMKRLQVVNIETAMSGFRSIVIRHCLDKGDD